MVCSVKCVPVFVKYVVKFLFFIGFFLGEHYENSKNMGNILCKFLGVFSGCGWYTFLFLGVPNSGCCVFNLKK